MRSFVENEGYRTLFDMSSVNTYGEQPLDFHTFLSSLNIITIQDRAVRQRMVQNPTAYVVESSGTPTAHRFSIDADGSLSPGETIYVPLHKIFDIYCNITVDSPNISLSARTAGGVQIDLSEMSAIPVYASSQEDCVVVAKNIGSEVEMITISFDVLLLDASSRNVVNLRHGPYTISRGCFASSRAPT
jgi:hypothetical protein